MIQPSNLLPNCAEGSLAKKRTRFWDKLASVAQTLKITIIEFQGWNYTV